jgi:hypothetical protein
VQLAAAGQLQNSQNDVNLFSAKNRWTTTLQITCGASALRRGLTPYPTFAEQGYEPFQITSPVPAL